MKQETYSEIRGTVRIHENVIATIVRKMACSVKGVSKISGSSFVDNIAEMVGSKKIHDRSIVVEMGESSVSVEVSINLYYGVSLPQVASAVQEAISRLVKDKTVLIIAHRMRTVTGADKIVVLSDGVVAEQGSPGELYQKNGIYTHMVQLQTESQNWAL